MFGQSKSIVAHADTSNELKEAIVAEIAEFLREDAQGQAYEEVEITNVSRMISFSVNDKRFELTLVEKRPPKAK